MLMGGAPPRLTAGHEEGLVQGRLSGPLDCQFGQPTFAKATCNGQAAPKNEPARAGGSAAQGRHILSGDGDSA